MVTVKLSVTKCITEMYLNHISGNGRGGSGCSHKELQLISRGEVTTNSRAGIVQLCIDGQWKAVCWRNGWNIHTANVACRQLGYLDNGEWC